MWTQTMRMLIQCVSFLHAAKWYNTRVLLLQNEGHAWCGIKSSSFFFSLAFPVSNIFHLVFENTIKMVNYFSDVEIEMENETR